MVCGRYTHTYVNMYYGMYACKCVPSVNILEIVVQCVFFVFAHYWIFSWLHCCPSAIFPPLKYACVCVWCMNIWRQQRHSKYDWYHTVVRCGQLTTSRQTLAVSHEKTPVHGVRRACGAYAEAADLKSRRRSQAHIPSTHTHTHTLMNRMEKWSTCLKWRW